LHYYIVAGYDISTRKVFKVGEGEENKNIFEGKKEKGEEKEKSVLVLILLISPTNFGF
jgi:hypothetical protein